jgi:lipopolysaccharide transport system permease protein
MTLQGEPAGTPGAVIIEPPAAVRFPDLGECVRRRQVLNFLVRKSLTLRYKQTVLGLFWVVLKPLLLMLVYNFVFSTILDRTSPRDDIPFPVFLFSGIVAWQYFSTTVSECVNSVSRDRELMKKVYFPRLFLPLVPIVTHFVDFLASFAILLVLMAGYGIAPGPELVALPVFVAVLVVFAAGAGVWLAPLNVKYRDVQYAVPFLLQIGFFLTPIIYSIDRVDEDWRWLYALNPLAGVIEGFRWSVIGGDAPGTAPVVVSTLTAIAVFATGLLAFGSQERDFVAEA